MSTDHDGSWLPGGDDPLDRRDLLVRAGGVGALVALGGLAGASRAIAEPSQNAGKVTAYFGQFGAIAEQEGIRKYVFKGFRGDVDPVFVPITAPTQFVDRVRAEAKAGKGNIDLLVGLHGDMVTFQNEGLIRGIDDVAKQVKTLPPPLVKIGKLGTNKQYYIPWMQATYVMVANKKALTTCRRARTSTASPTASCSSGRRRSASTTAGRAGSASRPARRPLPPLPPGLPGPGVHRATRTTSFKSKWARLGLALLAAALEVRPPAVADLQLHAGPAASGRGDGRVGSRRAHHLGGASTTRTTTSCSRRPQGRRARAYMPVLAGLGDPEDCAEPRGREGAHRVPRRRSAPQARTAAGRRLLPGRRGAAVEAGRPGLLAIAAAVKTQQRSKDALPSLLPGRARRPRAATTTASSPTRSRGSSSTGEDINKVLDDEGQKLQDVLNAAGAPCWKPDPPSTGTCQVGGENLARMATTVAEQPRAGSAAAAALAGSAVLADPAHARLPRRLLRLADGEVVPARLPGRGGQLVDRLDRPMYHDAEFKHALWFTLLLVVVIVPIQFVIAFVMALLVNATLQGRGLFLFIFILPLAVSDLAAGLVWQQIFTDHGYLNTILEHLGIIDQPKIWIDPSHSNWLLGEVVADRDVAVDRVHHDHPRRRPAGHPEGVRRGGGGVRRRASSSASGNVTLPMLKPALQVALLFRIIFAFEVFASVIAITGPREDDARGRVLRWQGDYLDPHVASAYALLILVLSLVAAGIAVQGPADAEGEAAAMTRSCGRTGSAARSLLRARVAMVALGDPADLLHHPRRVLDPGLRLRVPARAAAAPPLDRHAELLPPLGRASPTRSSAASRSR